MPGEDIFVNIRPANTIKHIAAIRRNWMRLSKEIEKPDSIDAEVSLRIEHESAAEGLVSGWRNVDLNGQPLPCTPDNVKMVMRRWPAFKEFVLSIAAKEANFSAQAVQSSIGVLKKS